MTSIIFNRRMRIVGLMGLTWFATSTALGQLTQDYSGSPNPGVGVLGSGAAGVPGPPTAPKPVSRPASWPGSPELDAAEERAPIVAPHPIGFGGSARKPEDLSMYRQRLPARQPPGGYAPPGQQTAASQPIPANTEQAGSSAPFARLASTSAQQRANDAMTLALPGALDIDGATVIAQVDGQPILASELLPAVNWRIAKNKGKIRPDDIPAARQFLLAQELESVLMLKMLLAAAKRKIPEKNYKDMMGHIGNEFYKEQIPVLMKEYEVTTRPELDAQLRAIGTSVEREKRAWIERIIAQQWLFSQNKKEVKEPTHEELLAYYHENVKEFQYPSKARWEQLTVNYGSKRNREDARRRIAMAGDEILRGAHFVNIAKAFSDGTTAAEGGQRDWTTKGSLSSDVLNEALFALPVGQMSPILEDRGAFHIIRVIERVEEGQPCSSDAQVKIKESLAKDDQRADRQKYLEELREKSVVWTIFDREKPETEQAAKPTQVTRQ